MDCTDRNQDRDDQGQKQDESNCQSPGMGGHLNMFCVDWVQGVIQGTGPGAWLPWTYPGSKARDAAAPVKPLKLQAKPNPKFSHDAPLGLTVNSSHHSSIPSHATHMDSSI